MFLEISIISFNSSIDSAFNCFIFLLIVLSFFSYGCGKKADPIAPSIKMISTKN
jgi:ABC-type transport system involved in cytochrome c biogenesis permease component